MDFLQYIIPIASCIIVYLIFEKASIIPAIIFKLILQIGLFFLDGTFFGLSNEVLPISTIVILLLVVLILTLIFTIIEYAVYNRTNSFFSYFILGSIIEFIVSYILVFALVFFVGILI